MLYALGERFGGRVVIIDILHALPRGVIPAHIAALRAERFRVGLHIRVKVCRELVADIPLVIADDKIGWGDIRHALSQRREKLGTRGMVLRVVGAALRNVTGTKRALMRAWAALEDEDT